MYGLNRARGPGISTGRLTAAPPVVRIWSCEGDALQQVLRPVGEIEDVLAVVRTAKFLRVGLVREAGAPLAFLANLDRRPELPAVGDKRIIAADRAEPDSSPQHLGRLEAVLVEPPGPDDTALGIDPGERTRRGDHLVDERPFEERCPVANQAPGRIGAGPKRHVDVVLPARTSNRARHREANELVEVRALQPRVERNRFARERQAQEAPQRQVGIRAVRARGTDGARQYCRDPFSVVAQDGQEMVHIVLERRFDRVVARDQDDSAPERADGSRGLGHCG